MEELSKQIEIENKKKDKKSTISKLEEERNKLMENKSKFDPKKYDTIIEAVKRTSIGERDILTIPLTLVQCLSEVGSSIPKKGADIRFCIEELERKKRQFENEIGNKLKEISDEMRKIEDKISEERKILESMPPTDVRVLKETRFEIQ
jgi:DNA repair exonuclease SbcCD ATPase subunit